MQGIERMEPETERTRESGSRPRLRETSALVATDHVYGVVSVLYHALRGIRACQRYRADAQRANDGFLQRFFDECCEEHLERAGQARELLLECLEEEFDEASFYDPDPT